jgi:alpha-1,2-mannosyltransferase
MKRWWLALVAVVTVAVVIYAVSVPGALTDLKVYRAGGASWLHGVPLYTSDFPFWLPFTYPPVSAVMFGVLAVLPFAAAAFLLTVVGLVALSLSTYWAAPSAVVPVVAVALALVLEPVRTTLTFGQVNLLLMAMVACDCLLPRTRYPRGLLIGLAAAVKLTPAVFVLFFLARRQVQPAVTTVVTFAAATGAGMLFAPADSLRYWYTTIFDPDRIGGAAFATNQSLRGALTRLDLPAGLTQMVWIFLAVVVLAVVWRGARRSPDPVVALLVVAAGGLVVSPVSWSHHWVWIVPALAYFAVHSRRRVLLVGVAAVFTVGHRFLPHARNRELEWTWWQHFVGDSYLLTALAFLTWAAVGARDVPLPGGTRAAVSVGGQR